MKNKLEMLSILAAISMMGGNNTYGYYNRRPLSELKEHDVEEPPQLELYPPIGLNREFVNIKLTKHGYTCEISGAIQYANQKSRIKHLRKWEAITKNWFLHTPINRIIQKHFVYVLNIEELNTINTLTLKADGKQI